MTDGMMRNKLETLANEAKSELKKATTSQSLEQLRVRYLGKKGVLTEILKGIKSLSLEERPQIGELVNRIKIDLQQLIEERKSSLEESQLLEKIEKEKIDVTLPGRGGYRGHLHPVTKVKLRTIEFFKCLGFTVAEGPEIEDEFHNFDSLNFKKYHPARTDMDTFYVEGESLLRTHTSPVQIRVMENGTPPFRTVAAGRVYRRDSDHTHTPMFHQLEGLVVDRYSTMADLKSILNLFVSQFFEEELKLRFRPSYFPFTEPSAEVDVECMFCHGKSAECRVCHEGWLEILGCGMVHPNVLRSVNIDPDEYRGFAFGVGLDRLAMLRYGIPDLRLLFENDLRFLKF